jgi:transcriptional/translational regulatory protein YebC/TACO1
MLLALDNGAENLESDDEYYEITCDPSEFSKLREELEKNGLQFVEAEVKLIPSTYITLDENAVRRMELILEKLDELDDVIDVYHNWDE